ncbi:MAG: hypothetical protein EAZ97_15690 [Bacteroidetes bacterium]|nr:MAG: hypothetical protein EAZ97_15690 [Bacteroidota bacterium]
MKTILLTGDYGNPIMMLLSLGLACIGAAFLVIGALTGIMIILEVMLKTPVSPTKKKLVIKCLIGAAVSFFLCYLAILNI